MRVILFHLKNTSFRTKRAFETRTTRSAMPVRCSCGFSARWRTRTSSRVRTNRANRRGSVLRRSMDRRWKSRCCRRRSRKQAPSKAGMTAKRHPTGTVSFLFTDIEGSTARWESHREAMQAALRSHDAILQSSIAANRGYVFKTIGDAFCAAFADPHDAVRAAVEAQRRIAEEDLECDRRLARTNGDPCG